MAQLMVIIGVGAGNGMAIVRRFAKGRFAIAIMARSAAKLQTY